MKRKVIIALLLILGLLLGTPASFASEQAPQDAIVLTVVYTENGNQVQSTFTQAEIDAMTQGPFTYSNYNTYPSYGTNNSIYGACIDDILAAAGVNIQGLSGSRAIRFVSGDGSGYASTVTWGQLTEDRFFYDQNGVQIAQVPSIIGFSSDDPNEGNLPRNFFGQAASGEQTRNMFVRNVARIEVMGNAGTWGTAAASPVSGSQVSAGDLIRLSTPAGAPDEAKIYYTLDGTEPAKGSAMYNLVANQWLNQKGMTENDPIVVPAGSGTLIVRTKIIGFGMNDGAENVFLYPYRSDSNLPGQAAPQGLAGGILALVGTTTAMEYNTSASAPAGWVRCTNGSTSVAAGTYFVRFAATPTHRASPSVMIVAGKYSQAAPTGLTGGIEAIFGTTTAMQYHTNPSASNGWAQCLNGSTPLVPGVYHVRFTATETHDPSPAVRVVVLESTGLSQTAPTGLIGGNKVISGTTTAMEYNTNAVLTSGWIRCSAGKTNVEAGTYFVRFAATQTHNASPAVMVVVTDEDETGEAVVTVYINGRVAKAFSQNDITAMPKHGPATYSGHNTWPTYETLSGVTGVRVMDLLAVSGVSNLSSRQGIRFTSGDGYSSTVTVGQLEEPRYFYSSGGARGGHTPSVINVAQGSDFRRLAFGQASAGEQVRHALVKNVVRIDVQSNAGNWGSPGAAPANGSTVKKGEAIRLVMPSGQADAKIYYTLDGSEPTRNSKLYNPVADRWLNQKGMKENTPIAAPSDKVFTIKAKLIGIGKNDGPTVSFSYNSRNQEETPERTVLTPTIDELESGDVSIGTGESIFVPGPPGSVIWNPDEMDGYYDEELGGYVLTPKKGVEGKVWFTYIDEDGVERLLSVDVEASAEEESLTIDDSDVALAAGYGDEAGGGSEASGTNTAGGGITGGLPQWLFIIICAGCAAACAAFIPKLPSLFRKQKNAA